MNKFCIKFLYKLCITHIALAFESGILFKLASTITSKVLKDLSPQIHFRFSYLAGKTIRVNSPYMMVAYFNDLQEDFLSFLKI